MRLPEDDDAARRQFDPHRFAAAGLDSSGRRRCCGAEAERLELGAGTMQAVVDGDPCTLRGAELRNRSK